MPYTLSHPGFILPLKKWNPELFSTTGLVFGSIAPDYDILLRLTNARFHLFQYDWKEILFLILPLAVFSGVYFHLLIRKVLLKLLPSGIRARIDLRKRSTFKTKPAFRIMRLTWSALAAILLHIFLDNISHWDAFPFKIYGWIYYNNYWAGIIYYYLALYTPALLFSVAGLILIYYYMDPKNLKMDVITEAIRHRPFLEFSLVFLIITLAIAAIKIFVSGLEKGFYIDHIVISLTNGMLVSFYLTPAIFYFRNRYRKGPAGNL